MLTRRMRGVTRVGAYKKSWVLGFGVCVCVCVCEEDSLYVVREDTVLDRVPFIYLYIYFLTTEFKFSSLSFTIILFSRFEKRG